MDGLYLWIKALHVVAVISWMAGMLYLPRLFVYHSQTRPGSEASERYKVQERLLLKAITNPAMIVSWIAGIAMIVMGGWLTNGDLWMWLKLALVLGMSGAHGVLSKHRRMFEMDRRTKSERYFRILNEVPTVLMLGIVILVIVKPF